jgi:hypothetical protein
VRAHTEGVAEVLFTDEFQTWWEALSEGQQDAVAVAVGVLADRGVGLGFPRSSAIRGSRIGLRELRVQSSGRPLRVFYAFDPRRKAVLLLGGDKTGRPRFYREMIPLAERIFEEYVAETGQDEEG